MGKLVAFNSVTLDGFFADAKGDMSWAHKEDAEWNAFVVDNANSGGMLLFGRITYQMMAGYWPTPYALQNDPIVAERMNELPKVVFSRTLDKTEWNNTTLLKGDLANVVRRLKQESEKNVTILGSGTLIAQLTQEALIDEYQLVVNPIVLGKGRTMFDGVEGKIPLRLTSSRPFSNGNVLLCYERR